MTSRLGRGVRNVLADRALAAEASRTIRANQRAEELRRQGLDVVNFTVGEPDFPTPDHIKAAARRALDENFTKYTASAGIPELREAIAEKSRRENGIPTDAAHTLVTPAKHALFATLMACVNPGDEVLVPDPGFVSYVPQIRLFGGLPVRVPLRKEHGLSLWAEDVERAVTRRTKAVLLCSPSNPTGRVDPPDQVRAVVDLAVDRDLLLVSDEIYEKVLYEGRHVSPAGLPGGADRTVTINGFSKSFSMTGWRVGWLHAPDPVFDAIARIQTQSITQVTSFVQKAAVDALRGPQDAVGTMVEELRARRDLVVGEVAGIPGLSLLKPQGAFYAWIESDHGLPADELAEFLLEKAHVAVVSGTAFGATGGRHFRLSYATSRERIREGFRRMGAALAALKGVAAARAKT